MRKTRTRSGLLLSAVLAISLALASCASGGNEAASNAPGERTLGEELVIGYPGSPLSLNPALGLGSSSVAFLSLAYTPLIYQMPDGSYAPGLATEFGYADDTNTAFDLTLRDDAVFSDGEAFNAEAVKKSLEYFRSAGGPLAEDASILKNVEVISPTEVRLVFSEPNPNVIYQLSQEGVMGNIISPKAVDNPSVLDKGTAGVGPYVLDSEATVAESTYVYVPNETYYDQEAILNSQVTLNIYPDASAALSALQTGQIDATVQLNTAVMDAAKSAGVEIDQQAISWLGLFLNDTRGEAVPALADERVRRAINLAIDRDTVVSATQAGFGKPTQQVCLEGTDCFIENFAPYAYNVEEAQALMAEAGYADGFDLPVATFVGMDQNGTLTQALGGQLAKIGVNVKVAIKNSPSEFNAALASKDYPVFLFGADYGSMYLVGSQLVGKSAFRNPFVAEDPVLDELMATGAGQPAEERAATYKEATERMSELGWWAPVTTTSAFWLHKDVVGLKSTPEQPYAAANIVGPSADDIGWSK